MPTGRWEPIIVFASLAGAVGLVALRWVRWPPSTPRPPLDQPIGPVNFRFGESWASMVTAVGAFLTAIVASELLPTDDPLYISLPGFVLLTLLFGFLVIVAPFVYSATSTRPQAGPPGEPPGPEGRVWAFLLSTAVTLWAVFGELATMAFAGVELVRLGTIFYVFLVVLLAVAGLMVGYSWRTIRWVLEVQAQHEVARRASMAPGDLPARPRWTVL